MNGITIDERNGRYRVKRTWDNGRFATLGIFTTPAQAIAYATNVVLELDPDTKDKS